MWLSFALALVGASAVLIVVLTRRDLSRARPALRFDSASDRTTALGCPAALLGLALALAVFVALAFGL